MPHDIATSSVQPAFPAKALVPIRVSRVVGDTHGVIHVSGFSYAYVSTHQHAVSLNVNKFQRTWAGLRGDDVAMIVEV
jgi:hypothetical protein